MDPEGDAPVTALRVLGDMDLVDQVDGFYPVRSHLSYKSYPSHPINSPGSG